MLSLFHFSFISQICSYRFHPIYFPRVAPIYFLRMKILCLDQYYKNLQSIFPIFIAIMTIQLQAVSIMIPQMAIAAVAHIFVFSAEPYRYLPSPEYVEVTTETAEAEVKLDEDNEEEKPCVLETTETQIKAPGTSITESVQDIVLKGGQHVRSSNICVFLFLFRWCFFFFYYLLL